MIISSTQVSAETISTWEKALTICQNPLGLDDNLLEESLEVCPPIAYPHATHLGRYLIPNAYVRYDEQQQPRDKNNDADHVNDLVNNFEAIGYRIDAQPPIVCFDDKDNNQVKLRAQSGYNRSEALQRIGQDCFFYDIYSYESMYWEVVARNKSNHHSNPQLSQKWTDYQKEVVNAVDSELIPREKDAIDEFVDLIAADKTSKTRNRIKKACYNSCDVFPNFRTYNSVGHGKNTLNGFIQKHGFAPQGINGRTDEELQNQGYIVYCAGEGNGKASWARGIVNATRLGIPTWVIGYSTNRVSDLQEFRENWIEQFNETKELFLCFAENITGTTINGDIDEKNFPVKLAGFMAQYMKPNAEHQGKPTECGLVDVFGNSIEFDPEGDCLTLTQP